MKRFSKILVFFLFVMSFSSRAIELDEVQAARDSIRSICSCLDASNPNSRSANCAAITPGFFNPLGGGPSGPGSVPVPGMAPNLGHGIQPGVLLPGASNFSPSPVPGF